MNRKQLLARIAQGHLQNISFNDMRDLVEAFGFVPLRVSGSHHIFGRSDVSELVNLQESS